MKKLNITKEAFNKSKYFTNKYGTLKYVSESGKLFKTSKGKVLKFNESSEVKCDGCGEMVHDDTVEIVDDQVLCDKCRDLKKESQMQCPHCGEFVDDEENECPYCNEQISTSNDDNDDTYPFTVTDIEWDADDKDDIDALPTEVKVDVPMEILNQGSSEVEEYISNYLSDTYGFTHTGFTIDGMDDDMMQESHDDIREDPSYECPNCGSHNCEFMTADDLPDEGYFEGSKIHGTFQCLDCEQDYDVEYTLTVTKVTPN